MKLFVNYLKKNILIFIWTVCFLGMFALVCYLYGVPVQPALYTAQVTVVFGLLALLVGFFRFRRRWKELAKAKEDILYTEELPKAENVIEKEYQEIVAELKKKMSELEEKDQSSYREMIEYYTMWAHQIKTPIAAMRLLLQQEESDKNKELLSELFKIEQYVLMVLQYLRLGSESNDLVLKRQSLDDIIRQAVKKYAPLFIRKKLTLVYEPVNCQVLTDEKWLEFVLEQILSNAIKYTKRGSVAIYMDEQVEKTLVIADTGIGIAAEDLPRVFEKGYTGCNGRYDKGSTGIGLYLCRRALNRLSHTIRIESELGQGTRVYINLETVHLDSD